VSHPSANIDCSDEGSLRQLYLKLGKLLLSKVLYIVGTPQIAEEIVQDMFLKVWQRKLNFETQGAAYCWLFKASHNRAIDYLRSQKRSKEVPVESFETIDFSFPKDPSARMENRDLVVKIMDQLETTDLQILCYLVIDGLAYGEIAELTDLSERTVRRKMQNIRFTSIKFKEAQYG